MRSLCDTCFTYSDILVFLTFWIYSDTITYFQVLGPYFPFCKKIVNVSGFSSAVSGLGLIEKLYFLKKGLRPLCQALVHYCKKTKPKSGLCPLSQVLSSSPRGEFSAPMTRLVLFSRQKNFQEFRLPIGWLHPHSS